MSSKPRRVSLHQNKPSDPICDKHDDSGNTSAPTTGDAPTLCFTSVGHASAIDEGSDSGSDSQVSVPEEDEEECDAEGEEASPPKRRSMFADVCSEGRLSDEDVSNESESEDDVDADTDGSDEGSDGEPSLSSRKGRSMFADVNSDSDGSSEAMSSTSTSGSASSAKPTAAAKRSMFDDVYSEGSASSDGEGEAEGHDDATEAPSYTRRSMFADANASDSSAAGADAEEDATATRASDGLPVGSAPTMPLSMRDILDPARILSALSATQPDGHSLASCVLVMFDGSIRCIPFSSAQMPLLGGHAPSAAGGTAEAAWSLSTRPEAGASDPSASAPLAFFSQLVHGSDTTSTSDETDASLGDSSEEEDEERDPYTSDASSYSSVASLDRLSSCGDSMTYPTASSGSREGLAATLPQFSLVPAFGDGLSRHNVFVAVSGGAPSPPKRPVTRLSWVNTDFFGHESAPNVPFQFAFNSSGGGAATSPASFAGGGGSRYGSPSQQPKRLSPTAAHPSTVHVSLTNETASAYHLVALGSGTPLAKAMPEGRRLLVKERSLPAARRLEKALRPLRKRWEAEDAAAGIAPESKKAGKRGKGAKNKGRRKSREGNGAVECPTPLSAERVACLAARRQEALRAAMDALFRIAVVRTDATNTGHLCDVERSWSMGCARVQIFAVDAVKGGSSSSAAAEPQHSAPYTNPSTDEGEAMLSDPHHPHCGLCVYASGVVMRHAQDPDCRDAGLENLVADVRCDVVGAYYVECGLSGSGSLEPFTRCSPLTVLARPPPASVNQHRQFDFNGDGGCEAEERNTDTSYGGTGQRPPPTPLPFSSAGEGLIHMRRWVYYNAASGYLRIGEPLAGAVGTVGAYSNGSAGGFGGAQFPAVIPSFSRANSSDSVHHSYTGDRSPHRSAGTSFPGAVSPYDAAELLRHCDVTLVSAGDIDVSDAALEGGRWTTAYFGYRLAGGVSEASGWGTGAIQPAATSLSIGPAPTPSGFPPTPMTALSPSTSPGTFSGARGGFVFPSMPMANSPSSIVLRGHPPNPSAGHVPSFALHGHPPVPRGMPVLVTPSNLLDNYELCALVGQGAEGRVLLVKSRIGHLHAVKIIAFCPQTPSCPSTPGSSRSSAALSPATSPTSRGYVPFGGPSGWGPAGYGSGNDSALLASHPVLKEVLNHYPLSHRNLVRVNDYWTEPRSERLDTAMRGLPRLSQQSLSRTGLTGLETEGSDATTDASSSYYATRTSARTVSDETVGTCTESTFAGMSRENSTALVLTSAGGGGSSLVPYKYAERAGGQSAAAPPSLPLSYLMIKMDWCPRSLDTFLFERAVAFSKLESMSSPSDEADSSVGASPPHPRADTPAGSGWGPASVPNSPAAAFSPSTDTARPSPALGGMLGPDDFADISLAAVHPPADGAGVGRGGSPGHGPSTPTPNPSPALCDTPTRSGGDFGSPSGPYTQSTPVPPPISPPPAGEVVAPESTRPQPTCMSHAQLVEYRRHQCRLQNLAMGRHIFEGLSYVHDSGLVHLDVKPLNIFVVVDERCVLAEERARKAALMVAKLTEGAWRGGRRGFGSGGPNQTHNGRRAVGAAADGPCAPPPVPSGAVVSGPASRGAPPPLNPTSGALIVPPPRIDHGQGAASAATAALARTTSRPPSTPVEPIFADPLARDGTFPLAASASPSYAGSPTGAGATAIFSPTTTTDYAQTSSQSNVSALPPLSRSRLCGSGYLRSTASSTLPSAPNTARPFPSARQPSFAASSLSAGASGSGGVSFAEAADGQLSQQSSPTTAGGHSPLTRDSSASGATTASSLGFALPAEAYTYFHEPPRDTMYEHSHLLTKIGDFGISATSATHIPAAEGLPSGALRVPRGTATYASPEQAREEGKSVTGASDVFSAALVLLEMYGMECTAAGNRRLLGAASRGGGARESIREELWTAYPQEMAIIAACLRHQPEERPSARDVKRLLKALLRQVSGQYMHLPHCSAD